MYIAINKTQFLMHGCPNCGCNSMRPGNITGGGCMYGTCRECSTTYVVLEDNIINSPVGFNTGKYDDLGHDIFEYPIVQEHPRTGIPWHPWVPEDPRPENGGEYWKSRGIGYDLSGFVKSKAAGERLLEMVKEVLGVENPTSWLDYREFEPEWIQFKFQKEEFDLDKLDKISRDMGGVVTKRLLEMCKR